MYEGNQLKKMILLECLSLLVQHGVRYKMLVDDLHQYLPNILRMSQESHECKAHKRLLMTIYEILVNVSDANVAPSIWPMHSV